MLCSAPTKRIKLTSKGFTVEQPSANNTTRIIPNSLQPLNILQQVTHVFSSIPDNSTMIQRTHAAGMINNSSHHTFGSTYDTTHCSVPPPSLNNAGEHESSPPLTRTQEDNMIDFDLHDEEEVGVNHNQTIDTTLETGSHLLDQQSLSSSIVSNRYTSSEYAGIKLWNLLDKNKAPKCLYDEICHFIRSTNTKDLLHIPSSKTLLRDVNQRSQTGLIETYKLPLNLPSGNKCAITVYDFRKLLFSLLDNNDLMQPSNLLVELKNDTGPPVYKNSNPLIYGDLNNSEWFKETHAMMCGNQDDLLVPIILFIDETTVASNGNCSIEPVSFTLGIFNRETRGKEDASCILGYIPSMDSNRLYDTKGKKNGNTKLQDYHAALQFILQSLKAAQQCPSGMLQWKYHGRTYNLKIPIMFIIGDTKGHDKLVGRYTNYVNSNGLVRDCKCLRSDGHLLNPNCELISANEIRELIRKERIESSKDANIRDNSYAESLKTLSFHRNIENAWNDLHFGANQYGINGACPPCLLHVFKLRFPDNVADAFLNLLGTSSDTIGRDRLDGSLQHVLHFSSKQSPGSEFPDMNPFKLSINPKHMLTADSKYARLFTLYVYSLTQIGDNLLREFMVCKKNRNNPPSATKINMIISSMKKLMERTLTIYQWLYQENHNKIQIQRIRQTSLETLAHHQIHEYLDLYKSVLSDECCGDQGYNFKFAKFHLMQHFPMYISRFGSPKNYDGGASERNHKLLTKHHARKTQMRQGLLSYQTGKSLSQQRLMKSALNSQMAFDDEDNSDDDIENGLDNWTLQGSHFELVYSGVVGNNGQKTISTHWKKQHKQQTQPYDDNMLEFIVNELWGKNELHTEVKSITVFTELKYHDYLFRAHPSYNSKEAWFDFARFQWDDPNDLEYPARLLMFLDLRQTRLNDDSHLSNDIYAVIQSSLELDQISKNKLGKNLEICRYWKMESKYRIVSVDCICGTSFVLNNFSQSRHANPGDDMKMLEKIIEIKPIETWKEVHMIS